MKKIISLLSAIAILFSSITAGIIGFNVFAQPEELLISDCETLTGWTKTGGNALSINANGFTGKAVACNINSGAFRTATFTSAPIDVSAYKNIEWDVMMHNGGKAGMWDDIKKYYGDEVFLKIGSSATDYNVYRLSKMTVKQDTTNPLWYHFSIDMSVPSSTTGSFDSKKMTMFYFTTIDGGVNTAVSNGHIRIDNIYARNLLSSEPEQVDDIILSECETIDNWSYTNAGMTSVTPNGMTGKAININTSYGALRKFTFTKNVDLSKHNTLEFDFFCMKAGDVGYDMWSDVKASYSDKIAVEVSDGTNTNVYGLNKWKMTAVGNNWHHVVINLKDATTASKNLDLAKFKTFSIYTNTTGSLDNTLPGAAFRVDNLIAHFDKDATGPSTPEGEEGVWTIPGSYEKTTQGTFSYIVKDFKFDLSEYKKSDLYLTMRIFVENKDGSDNVLDFTSDGQIELTSSGDCDKQEVSWNVPKLGLKSGWNDVRLLISNPDSETNPGLNLANINYFRFYSRKAGEAQFNVKIQDIKITNIKEEKIVGSYFADGMMFRQNKPMNVFGNVTEQGLKVTAKLKDKNGLIEEKTTTSAANGAWNVSFTGRAGGYEKYSIEIYVGNTLKKTIKDILIGELWLAAGQSNMEFFVLQTIPDYDYSLIPLNEYVRFYDEPLVPGGVSSILPSAPAGDIEGAKWADGSNAVDVKYVSAIAYYMSLQLQQELNVPIGFINAAKGASVIESWLPREAVENDAVIKASLQERGIYKTAEQLDSTSANWTYLTTLYNSKIAPLAGIEISGMLWYQGESNIKYAEDNGYNTFYKNSLEALIDSYSKLFGYKDGKMPFVCAHLAPYNYSSIRSDYATVLADFAEMLTDVTKNTSAQMIQIPIYDLALDYKDPPINNPDPIHPNAKSDVAVRFANAVLAGVYAVGDKDASNAPVAKSYKVNGNKIEITFENVGSGLKALSGDTLHGFAICGSDRVFVKADAEIISADTVAVYSDKVASPVAATYAWSSFNMNSNLCNSAGIPAVPYRTDKKESVYYLSMDWGYCDFENTWDAKITLEAGYKPSFISSNNAVVSYATDDKLEGSAATKLIYTATESKKAIISPVLNYSGMVNNYQNYSGITLNVKNNDNRTKKLSVEIVAGGEIYNASVTTGTVLATEYDVAKGDYQEYTFNFGRLVNAEGKVLRDSKTVLKTMTELNIVIGDSKDGDILFDDIYLRADKLATPGSQNDQYVDGVVDTTPGSLDSSGNMWLSDADTNSGWAVTGTELKVDKENKTQGKASVGATGKNGVLKQIAFTSGTPLDVTDYDYLEFDIYFSNMKWFNSCESMMFELTSSGGPDNESDRYMKGYLSGNQPEFYDAAASGTDEGAWYHVKLVLGAAQTQARGGLNQEKFSFFRFFTIGAVDAPDFEIRLDNLKFTKDPKGDAPITTDPAFGKVIDKTSMWLTDGDSLSLWSATGSDVILDSGNKTQGKSSVGATGKKGVLRQIALSSKNPIDISSYDYLEFDIYFSNMKWFPSCESVMFELTSSAGPDNESNRYMKGYLSSNQPDLYDAGVNGSAKGAWYHVKLVLDAPQTQARGGLNQKKFDFFRFFTTGAKNAPDFDVRLDNLKFTKDPSGEAQTATDPSYGKVIDKNSMWMTDGDTLTLWSASGTDVSLNSKNKTQGKGAVSVTAKGGLLKQIAFTPKKSIDISDYQYLEFDIYFSSLDWYKKCNGTMFELTSAGTCDKESNRYTKSSMLEASPAFAADIESGKGGGKWYHFKLNLDRPHTSVKGGLDKTEFDYFRFYSVELEKGAKDYTMLLDNMKFTKGEKIGDIVKTDKYLIINNGDSAAGWSSPGQEVMFDGKKKTEGKGSVSVTAKNGVLKELAYRPAKPIDLSDYKYLKFDLFLSDITCLSTSTGFMVEMTSSGTCDDASNRYMKSAILAACPELAADVANGSVGNKWYSFCFDLSRPQNQVKGGLNMKAFNFFRIYFNGSPAGTPDCIVRLDNLRVTVDGINRESASGGGQVINFGSGNNINYKNIGNKLNGGLLADELTPMPKNLITMIIAIGVAFILSVSAMAVVLVIYKRKKQKLG